NWGYIWIKTYDDFVYRLDPSTEEFIRIAHPGELQINNKIDKLFFLPSGEIWLTTYNNGCLKVTTDPVIHKLSVEHLEKRQQHLPDDKINDIFEDREKNVWVLTAGGIALFENTGKKIFY